MIAANAAFDFERTVPSSILTILANDCVIVSEESAKYKTRQMLKTGQSPNILPAKFSRYTVCRKPESVELIVTATRLSLPFIAHGIKVGQSSEPD